MEETRKNTLYTLGAVLVVLTAIFALAAGFFSIFISILVTGIAGLIIGINGKDKFIAKLSGTAIAFSLVSMVTFAMLIYHSNM